MTETTDLIVFLNARLDEDERELAKDPPVGLGYANLSARMLREVEVKRAILQKASDTWHWYQGELSEDGGDKYGDGTLNDVRERWDTWEIALRLLAAVYSDHPDYRPEWATARG